MGLGTRGGREQQGWWAVPGCLFPDWHWSGYCQCNSKGKGRLKPRGGLGQTQCAGFAHPTSTLVLTLFKTTRCCPLGVFHSPCVVTVSQSRHGGPAGSRQHKNLQFMLVVLAHYLMNNAKASFAHLSLNSQL